MDPATQKDKAAGGRSKGGPDATLKPVGSVTQGVAGTQGGTIATGGPGRARNVHYEEVQTTLGLLYVIFHGDALLGITRGKPPAIVRAQVPEAFKKQLADYFEGKVREFDHEVSFMSGTDFEKRVWLALRKVPYGQTRPYKWLSEALGRPGANRAVGQALSKNPVPIVLPCHRIIASDGGIGGYSGGIEMKRRLLDLEYYHSMGQ